MKLTGYLIVIGVFLCFNQNTLGQTNTLQVGAEIRPRILLDNGYKSPQAKNNDTPVYTTQRTRLNMLFTNEKFESCLSVQDVRIWGADNNYKSSGNYGDTHSLCLHQGWVKLKLNEPVFIKAGRQEFSYDDQRIISARNWNDYQITYDAILFEYLKTKHRIHMGVSYNADNKSDLIYPTEKFKTFDFLHYRYKTNKLCLSSIAVVTGNTLNDTTTQTFYRATYGFNIQYQTNRMQWRLSTYYQHNLNNYGSRVSAYCISASANYQLLSKLWANMGYDLLSGNNSNTASTVTKRFDILYGRRHSYYGYIDFFSNTPQQGLQDAMVKLTYKPSPLLEFQLHGHYFMLATSIGHGFNKQLGQEIDVKIKWKIHALAVLECGYSAYNTTPTLMFIKDVEHIKTPQFCYLMLTVTPSCWINL